MIVLAETSYVPASEFIMALLWLAFTILAFNGMLGKDPRAKVAAVCVGVLFVVIGCSTQ